MKPAAGTARPRDHAARVGTVIGFRQSKAPDQFAARQRRQVLTLLRLGAELMDGQHDQ